jgi:hypothetical protein
MVPPFPSTKQLIKSDYITKAALGLPGVVDLPWIASRKGSRQEAQWLARQIDVLEVAGTPVPGEIVLISMKGTDPRQLAVLVNAVARAYVDCVVREARDLLMRRKEHLKREYEEQILEVRGHRDLYGHLANRLGLDDAGGDKANFQPKQNGVADAGRRIRMRQGEILLKQQELANPKNRKPEDAAKQTMDLAILETELAELESRFDEEIVRRKNVSEMKRELGLTTESLATAQRTANQLGFELEQCNLQLKSLERITVLQEAPMPALERPVDAKPLLGDGKKDRKACKTKAPMQ